MNTTIARSSQINKTKGRGDIVSAAITDSQQLMRNKQQQKNSSVRSVQQQQQQQQQQEGDRTKNEFTVMNDMVAGLQLDFLKRERELNDLLAEIRSKENQLAYSEVQTRQQAEQLSTISSSYLFRKNTLDCLRKEANDFHSNEQNELTSMWRHFSDSLTDAKNIMVSFDEDSRYLQKRADDQKKDLGEISIAVDYLRSQQRSQGDVLAELKSSLVAAEMEVETSRSMTHSAEETLERLKAQVYAMQTELAAVEVENCSRAEDRDTNRLERDDAARRLAQSRADADTDRHNHAQELHPLQSRETELASTRVSAMDEAAALALSVAEIETAHGHLVRALEALWKQTHTAKAEHERLQAAMAVETAAGKSKETLRDNLRVELENLCQELEAKRGEAAQLEAKFEESVKSLSENLSKLRGYHKSGHRQQSELKRLQERLHARMTAVQAATDAEETEVFKLQSKIADSLVSTAAAAEHTVEVVAEAEKREGDLHVTTHALAILREETLPAADTSLLRLTELRAQRQATAACKTEKMHAIAAAKEILWQMRGERDGVEREIVALQQRAATLADKRSHSIPSSSSIPVGCDDPTALLAEVDSEVLRKRDEFEAITRVKYEVEAAPILSNLQHIAKRGPVVQVQMAKDHARRVEELKAKLADAQKRAALKREENARLKRQVDDIERQRRATAAVAAVAEETAAFPEALHGDGDDEVEDEEEEENDEDGDAFFQPRGNGTLGQQLSPPRSEGEGDNDTGKRLRLQDDSLREEEYESSADDSTSKNDVVRNAAAASPHRPLSVFFSSSARPREEVKITQQQQHWQRRYGVSTQPLFLSNTAGANEASTKPATSSTLALDTARKLTYSPAAPHPPQPTSDDESDISAFSLFTERAGVFGTHQAKRKKIAHVDSGRLPTDKAGRARVGESIQADTKQKQKKLFAPTHIRPSLPSRLLTTYGHRGCGDTGSQGFDPFPDKITRSATPHPAPSRTYGGKVTSLAPAPLLSQEGRSRDSFSTHANGALSIHAAPKAGNFSQLRQESRDKARVPSVSWDAPAPVPPVSRSSMPKPTKKLGTHAHIVRAAAGATSKDKTSYAQTLSDWFFDEDVNI